MSDLSPLLRDLAGDDEWARHSALQRLREEGLPGSDLDLLRDALDDDDDPAHRSGARMALAVLAAPGNPDHHRAAGVLRDALRSPRADLRVLAAVALGETGDPEAARPLITALEDPDTNVAAAAAESLGTLEHAPAVGPLSTVASEGGFWVRAAAVLALGRIRDPRAISALAKAAEMPELKESVAEALRAIGHPEALPVLEQVHDAAGDTALLAAGAILCGHPRISPPDWLVAAAREAEPRLRRILEEGDDPPAARLLGLAATDSGLDFLVALVGPPRRSEAALTGILAAPERRRADAILSRLPAADGDECVSLLSLLPPVDAEGRVDVLVPLLDDADPAIRAAAAEALARAPAEQAFPVLAAHLDRNRPSAEVLRAMGNLGGSVCIALLPLLADPSPDVRTAAAEALGRCAGQDVAQQLSAALDREEEAGPRGALLRAYGRAAGPDAVPRLSAALDDADEGVRLAAIEGLGATGDPVALPHLAGALERSGPEALTALRALGDVGHPDGAPLLEPWLRSADVDVRRTAAGAAARVPRAISAASVRQMSEDADALVRILAARILGGRGPDGQGRLQELASEDPDPVVRTEARRIQDGEG